MISKIICTVKIQKRLIGEISQIFQCSFTLFFSKSHEHRFNAVSTAFSKKQGMPTYTSQKFQNKTRFYLHFSNLCVGLLFSKKKIAFRNLKKILQCSFTHFVFSKQNKWDFRHQLMTKISRLSDAEIGEITLRKIQKILPKAIEKIEP